jgi:hypothetical protein
MVENMSKEKNEISSKNLGVFIDGEKIYCYRNVPYIFSINKEGKIVATVFRYDESLVAPGIVINELYPADDDEEYIIIVDDRIYGVNYQDYYNDQTFKNQQCLLKIFKLFDEKNFEGLQEYLKKEDVEEIEQYKYANREDYYSLIAKEYLKTDTLIVKIIPKDNKKQIFTVSGQPDFAENWNKASSEQKLVLDQDGSYNNQNDIITIKNIQHLVVLSNQNKLVTKISKPLDEGLNVKFRPEVLNTNPKQYCTLYIDGKNKIDVESGNENKIILFHSNAQTTEGDLYLKLGGFTISQDSSDSEIEKFYSDKLKEIGGKKGIIYNIKLFNKEKIVDELKKPIILHSEENDYIVNSFKLTEEREQKIRETIETKIEEPKVEESKVEGLDETKPKKEELNKQSEGNNPLERIEGKELDATTLKQEKNNQQSNSSKRVSDNVALEKVQRSVSKQKILLKS